MKAILMKKEGVMKFILIMLLLSPVATFSQPGPDSANTIQKDSSLLNAADTTTAIADFIINAGPKIKSYNSIVNDILASNKFINVKDAPVYLITAKKKGAGKEFVFYSLCLLVLLLGLFKTFYKGYFNNLFRVFFNTSLRQTQLTDQLLQAKLPSFILNIFFAFTAGTFIWLLFANSHSPKFISQKLLLPFCILGVGALYFIKYCILKFIGWVSTMQETIDSYIFYNFSN